MKFCPQCTAGFPDNASTCPVHGVMLSEIRDLKPGMMIRRTYRIIRKLGQGGMGSVYLARHTLMDEPRALKFLASEFSTDQAFTSRFLREVRTLRQVRHRNVVDCGDLEPAEDDSLFFSMEFVDGPDLRGFLHAAPRPFDVKQALEIVRGVAQGLGAAHALGLVHRDIKPENILMAQAGEVCVPKIADFGIVATKESSGTHTRTGGSLLTPPYAAPEQWRGMRAAELDGRTDLYALGGVLFEMLTGRTAFDAENYEGWAEQHRNTPPPPPSSLRPELANWKGLDALVLRLLAKDREQRPRDVIEVLGLLGAVHYVAPPPRRVTVVEPQRAQTVVEPKSLTPVIADPAEEPEANKPRKRRFWVGEAVIVAVVGIVVFVSWQDNRERPSEPVFDSSTQGQVNGQPASDFSVIEQQAETLLKQKNYTQALPLFDQACTGGIADACDNLGAMYENKKAGPPDLTRASQLYDRACQAGSAKGCNSLGAMYENGRGVTKDLAQATTYYQKACKGGLQSACNNWLVEIR
jgi:serine/threonine-protein kinase